MAGSCLLPERCRRIADRHIAKESVRGHCTLFLFFRGVKYSFECRTGFGIVGDLNRNFRDCLELFLCTGFFHSNLPLVFFLGYWEIFVDIFNIVTFFFVWNA